MCAGIVLPFTAGYLLTPLAGLAALILLTSALMIFVGPVAHLVLARRAAEVGSYSPTWTALKVAAGILATVTILALLGLFNFA